MKKLFPLLILAAGLLSASTPTPTPKPGSFDIKVNANGDVLPPKNNSNPNGIVNFASGTLYLAGVPVGSGGSGGLTAPNLAGINSITSPPYTGGHTADTAITSEGILSLQSFDTTIGGAPGQLGSDIWINRFNHLAIGQAVDTGGSAPANAMVYFNRDTDNEFAFQNDIVAESDSTGDPIVWQTIRKRGTFHFGRHVLSGDEIGDFLFSAAAATAATPTPTVTPWPTGTPCPVGTPGATATPTCWPTSTPIPTPIITANAVASIAKIIVNASEDQITGHHGSTLKIQTVSNATTSLADRFIADGNGTTTIGNATTLALNANIVANFNASGSILLGQTGTATGNYISLTNGNPVKLIDRASSNGASIGTSNLTADVTVQVPPRSGQIELSDWLIKTTTYTALNGDKIQADTAATGAFTITLPVAPAVGNEILIQDPTSNWTTANLTIGRNGQKINGATSNFTANTSGLKLACIYVSSAYGWSVVSYGTSGGGGSVASDTIWNAAGDLAVASGNHSASVLPTGTNGQVLMVDTTLPSKTRWTTATSVPGILAKDGNGNISVNSADQGYETAALSSGIRQLTSANAPVQNIVCTGGLVQVRLPDVATIPIGKTFTIISDPTSNSTFTARAFSGVPTLSSINVGCQATFRSTATSGQGSWLVTYNPLVASSGTTLTMNGLVGFVGNISLTGAANINLGSVDGTLGSAAFTAASAYSPPLTFGLGLTRSSNNVTTTGAVADLAGISFAQNDILYWDGAHLVKLGIGTAGTVLTSRGALSSPYWSIPGPGTGNMVGANNLVEVASPVDARANIGVAIGADVQAYSTNLDEWSDIALAGGHSGAVADWLTDPTSAKLAAALTDENWIGGGKVLFSPGSINITSGKTVAFDHTSTFATTDAQTYTFPTTSATLARTDAANTFTGNQTIAGGSVTGLTTFGIKDSGNPTYELRFAATSSPTPSANRTLTLDMANADKTLRLVNSIALSSDGTGVRQLNIGAGGTLGSAAFQPDSRYLQTTNNLSEYISSAATVRTNIGLEIETDVQAYSGNLDAWSVFGPGPGTEDFVKIPNPGNFRNWLDSDDGFAGVDYTGSGKFVFDTSPILVTPNLGTPSAGVATNLTGTALGLTAGKSGIPVSNHVVNYTSVSGDGNTILYRPSSADAACTFTIASNASVPYINGTAITFVDLDDTDLTISIASDTLIKIGSGSTGTRTLHQYGTATAIKLSSTTWIITGNNLD